MVAFLVGLGTGLVVGFVFGAVWMAASTAKWNARLRDRFGLDDLDQLKDDEDE